MTTPRAAISGHETHIVHDPFLKRDVEVSSKLTDRLRGKYDKGPTMPDGEPEFGWSQFETPPIQHEAADAIDALQARVKELEEAQAELFLGANRLTTEMADALARALRAEQELNTELQTLKDNGIGSHTDAVVLVVDLRRQLALAQQERDEAVAALKPFAHVAGYLTDHEPDTMDIFESPSANEINAGHLRAARDLVRRLSAGPEKIAAANDGEERR